MRHYFDYGTKAAKRKGGDAPNAIALAPENGSRVEHGEIMWEGACAVFDHPNSGLAWSGISQGYLRECCKRVSKAEAYRVHPALKEYMERDI